MVGNVWGAFAHSLETNVHRSCCRHSPGTAFNSLLSKTTNHCWDSILDYLSFVVVTVAGAVSYYFSWYCCCFFGFPGIVSYRSSLCVIESESVSMSVCRFNSSLVVFSSTLGFFVYLCGGSFDCFAYCFHVQYLLYPNWESSQYKKYIKWKKSSNIIKKPNQQNTFTHKETESSYFRRADEKIVTRIIGNMRLIVC